jgi:hypothetical protein
VSSLREFSTPVGLLTKGIVATTYIDINIIKKQ